MKKSYKSILVISSFLFICSTSYSYAAEVKCSEYFDLNTGDSIKDLPNDLKQLGNILLCNTSKDWLVSKDSIEDLKAIQGELNGPNPNKAKIDKLKKSTNLKPIFAETNESLMNLKYKIIRNIFSKIDSEFDNKQSNINKIQQFSNNSSIPKVEKNVEFSFWSFNLRDIILGILVILSFLISALSIFLNFKNRKLIDGSISSLKKKISNTFNDEAKKNNEKFDNKLTGFVRIKDITSIKEKLDLLEKRLENSSKPKTIEFEKPSLDNDTTTYNNKVLERLKIEIKPKTFEEDLIEKFNNMTFRDFHEENSGKRVAITNSQDILVNNSIDPKLKDQEQGKYCIIPFEDISNKYYLFPTKSDPIKVDEVSRNIFKFTIGTENATYTYWNIVEPAIVNFESDFYNVIQHGKIDISGN